MAHALRGAGDRGGPLPSSLRDRMERTFGVGLRGVRVHADSGGDAVARLHDASAVTMGAEIFFRSNRYHPDDEGGQWLIAHELSHFVQQSRGSSPRGEGERGSLEAEATRAADAAVLGGAVAVAPSPSAPTFQCAKEDELRAALARIQVQINQERVRIAQVEAQAPKTPTWEIGESGKFERKDWAGIQRGETKRYYNLLEERDVLNLRLTYPYWLLFKSARQRPRHATRR